MKTTITKDQIAAIIAASNTPYQHGKWRKLAKESGIHRDQIWYWRKKLALQMREPRTSVCPTCGHRQARIKWVDCAEFRGYEE